MTKSTTVVPVVYGIVAASALLGVYFAVLTFVSGWNFTLVQFGTYWYFVVSLAVGFGIQIALYQYLKRLVHSGQGMGKVVGVSGTTSTAAMISCCAHYLVNILPVLGVSAFASFVGAYQVELFWIGILSNLVGIGYMTSRIIKFKNTVAL